MGLLSPGRAGGRPARRDRGAGRRAGRQAAGRRAARQGGVPRRDGDDARRRRSRRCRPSCRCSTPPRTPPRASARSCRSAPRSGRAARPYARRHDATQPMSETPGHPRHRQPRPGPAGRAAGVHDAPAGRRARTQLPGASTRRAPYRAAPPRARSPQRFPGERLVVPTGGYKTRANDTEFRFRPATEFAHLVGSHEPDAVLVVEADGSGGAVPGAGHGPLDAGVLHRPGLRRAVGRPAADRSTATSALLGIETRPLEELDKLVRHAARVVRGYDARVEALFDDRRGGRRRADGRSCPSCAWSRTSRRSRQLQEAVDATVTRLRGRRPRSSTAAQGHQRALGRGRLRPARPRRGQRRRLRHASAPPARTPARCTGPTTTARSRDGDLLLLDMGVEGHELYTADITRTLPVSGTFTPRQREVYDLVYAAQEAAHRRVPAGQRLPGAAPRRDAGARRTGLVRARRRSRTPRRRSPRTPSSTGATRCTASATCSASTCTTAPRPATEVYRKGPLQPGYVLTVEPGLYFQPDDLTVPEDLRGIGVRIEDDVVVTRRLPQPVRRAAARRRRRRGLDAGLRREARSAPRWPRRLEGRRGRGRRRPGDTLLVLESMKMEIPVLAEAAARSRAARRRGRVVQEGDLLAVDRLARRSATGRAPKRSRDVLHRALPARSRRVRRLRPALQGRLAAARAHRRPAAQAADPRPHRRRHRRRWSREVLREDLVEEFHKSNEADFAYSLPGVGRFRVNAFRSPRLVRPGLPPRQRRRDPADRPRPAAGARLAGDGAARPGARHRPDRARARPRRWPG